MKKVIRFPSTIERQRMKNNKLNNITDAIAHYIAGTIREGSQVDIVVGGKKYKGKIISVSKKDKGGNILEVEYVIPFLNSSDPLKTGKAIFSYKTISNE